jgi:serine phosphatase RsbU (regulator of sigma subunit)
MVFVREWPLVCSEVSLAILIFYGFRYGSARDRKIAVAFFAYFLVRTTLSVSLQNITHIGEYIRFGGWKWQLTSITAILMGGVTLAIFVRDLIRDRSEKQRLASELEAARAIQQVLIPEEIPITPGFSIHAVYKPFSEVGGDFFQILPVKRGDVLVVIGDVSGKGMPAAMTVSLLVGTVRTLAHYTESPGEVLAAMNQRMLGRSKGGFTTCLILRAEQDGTITAANAGHIAPYVLGKEIQMENGLPLGLSSGAHYAEATFALGENEQLTLVTDGVVEARDKSGTLLGFDRTATLTTQGAESIAQAAQAFGQDDDITVVTLTRLNEQPQSALKAAAPALSPSLA